MFVYIYICLGTSSKSACPHATCTMYYSMIQFKEKIMDQERDQCLQHRRERERASEITEKKEDRLRMPNVHATVETADRPRGPADSCCQGLGRPDSSL